MVAAAARRPAGLRGALKVGPLPWDGASVRAPPAEPLRPAAVRAAAAAAAALARRCVVPALVGAGVALAVVALTGNLGGDRPR